MNQYLLGLVTLMRQGGSPAQRPLFNRTIECRQALLEFYIYAKYTSHDDATLSYIGTCLLLVSPLQRGFLTQVSWQKGKGQRQCSGNGTHEGATGR